MQEYTDTVELTPTYTPWYQLNNHYKQYEPANENDVNVSLYITPEITYNETETNNKVTSYSKHCGIFLLLLMFVSFFIGLSIISLQTNHYKNSTHIY